MAKKKSNWALLGAVAGVCAAPFTGGTSLALTAAACGGLGFVGGKVVESALDNNSDDNSNIQTLQESWKIQNDQWKTMMEQNRAEIERMRQERIKKEEKIKKNDQEIDNLKSKLNDPNISEEEKKTIRNKLIIFEDDNKQLKKEIEKLKKDEEKKEKEKPTPPPTPTSLPGLNLPKFSAYDKLLVAAIAIIIIYYLFLRDKKRD